MTKESEIAEKRLFYKINMAQRVLFKFTDREAIKRFGVPLAQVTALLYLMKHNGCRPVDLSHVLLQNKSATTTLVSRMEKSGLIEKRKSVTDGRAFSLHISEKGYKIGKLALPMIKELNHKLHAKVSESDLKVIHRFLDDLITDFSRPR